MIRRGSPVYKVIAALITVAFVLSSAGPSCAYPTGGDRYLATQKFGAPISDENGWVARGKVEAAVLQLIDSGIDPVDLDGHVFDLPEGKKLSVTCVNRAPDVVLQCSVPGWGAYRVSLESTGNYASAPAQRYAITSVDEWGTRPAIEQLAFEWDTRAEKEYDARAILDELGITDDPYGTTIFGIPLADWARQHHLTVEPLLLQGLFSDQKLAVLKQQVLLAEASALRQTLREIATLGFARADEFMVPLESYARDIASYSILFTVHREQEIIEGHYPRPDRRLGDVMSPVFNASGRDDRAGMKEANARVRQQLSSLLSDLAAALDEEGLTQTASRRGIMARLQRQRTTVDTILPQARSLNTENEQTRVLWAKYYDQLKAGREARDRGESLLFGTDVLAGVTLLELPIFPLDDDDRIDTASLQGWVAARQGAGLPPFSYIADQRKVSLYEYLNFAELEQTLPDAQVAQETDTVQDQTQTTGEDGQPAGPSAAGATPAAQASARQWRQLSLFDDDELRGESAEEVAPARAFTEDVHSIVHITPEFRPFSKSGGLGDMIEGMSRAQAGQVERVSVVTYLYETADLADLRERGIPVEDTGMTVSVAVGSREEKAQVYKAVKGNVEVYLLYNDLYSQRPYLGQPKDRENVTLMRKIRRKVLERHGIDLDEIAQDQGAWDNFRYQLQFEQAVFFSKAALRTIEAMDLRPEVIHAHDWHTGLVPLLLNRHHDFAGNPYFRGVLTAFTIHSMEMTGEFNADWLTGVSGISWQEFDFTSMEIHGAISLLKSGLAESDVVNTVSEQYAREIATTHFGAGIDGMVRYRGDVRGILNGLDYEVYDPSLPDQGFIPYSRADVREKKPRNKEALQRQLGLDVNPRAPLVAISARMETQKGISLAIEAMRQILTMHPEAQFVLLGEGSLTDGIEASGFVREFPGRVSANFSFTDGFELALLAASDLFLMPSEYEPCGLAQMKALRYGSVPVVRGTGGLVDTVQEFAHDTNEGNGYVFQEQRYDPWDHQRNGLIHAIDRALVTYYDYPDKWDALVQNAMLPVFSWERPVQHYMDMYRTGRSMMGQTVVFLGPPAIGKGTYAGYLLRRYGLTPVSTSDLIRRQIREGTEIGRQCDQIMREGGLVPDEIVIPLVVEALTQERSGRGVILDGFPRTRAQAETLDNVLAERGMGIDGVINITAPEEVLDARVRMRVAEARASDQPVRSDDEPEALARRRQVYREMTGPVVEYYRAQGKIWDADVSARNLSRNVRHVEWALRKVRDQARGASQEDVGLSARGQRGVPGEISQALVDGIDAEKRRDVQQIVDEIEQLPSGTAVLITGTTASGKSTLTERIQQSLRQRTAVQFNLDHYYKNWDDMPRTAEGSIDFDAPDALDWDLLIAHLQQLLAGGTIQVPRFDMSVGKRTAETEPMRLEAGQVLLVEGIHALNQRMIDALGTDHVYGVMATTDPDRELAPGVLLDGTDVRLLRRLVRDEKMRGLSAYFTLSHWPGIRQSESQYILPTAENADRIANSFVSYELSALKSRALPLLEQAVEEARTAGDAGTLSEAERLRSIVARVPDMPEGIVLPEGSPLRALVSGGESVESFADADETVRACWEQGIARRYQAAYRTLAMEGFDQTQLLDGWDDLSSGEKENLLSDIERTDWQQLRVLFERYISAQGVVGAPVDSFQRAIPQEERQIRQDPRIMRAGREVLSWGASRYPERDRTKYGVIVVAGGTGSGLGYLRAKGLFPFAPLSEQVLYEQFVRKLLAAALAHGHSRMYPLVLMVSDVTEAETVTYFMKELGLWDLVRDRVMFVRQKEYPSLDRDRGKAFKRSRGHLDVGGAGHGDAFDYVLNPDTQAIGYVWSDSAGTLIQHPVVSWLEEFGVEYMQYTNVDNTRPPLAEECLLGLHALSRDPAQEAEGRAHISLGMVRKKQELWDPARQSYTERLGNVIEVDGRQESVDYGDATDQINASEWGDPSNRVVTVRSLSGATPIEHMTALKRSRDENGTERAILKFERSSGAKKRYGALLGYDDREAVFAPIKAWTGDETPFTAIARQSRFWRGFVSELLGVTVNEQTVLELPVEAEYMAPATVREMLIEMERYDDFLAALRSGTDGVLVTFARAQAQYQLVPDPQHSSQAFASMNFLRKDKPAPFSGESAETSARQAGARERLSQNGLFDQARADFAASGAAAIDNAQYWERIGISFETQKLDDHTLDPHIRSFAGMVQTDREEGPAVCDIGCGIGRTIDLLLEEGVTDIVGVDISPSNIEAARQRLPLAAERLIEGDILTAALPRGAFDGVIASDVLLYLSPEDQVRALAKMADTLTDKGLLFIRWAPGQNEVEMKVKTVGNETVRGWVFTVTPAYIATLLRAVGLDLVRPLEEETVTINPGTPAEREQRYLVALAQNGGSSETVRRVAAAAPIDGVYGVDTETAETVLLADGSEATAYGESSENNVGTDLGVTMGVSGFPVPLAEAVQNLRMINYNLAYTWGDPEVEALHTMTEAVFSHERPLTPELYRELVDRYARYLAGNEERRRNSERYGLATDERIVYYCMEFGLTERMNIYGGGLGVLAGDHVRAASDRYAQGTFMGVGLAYRFGYFQQQLDESGRQKEAYPVVDFEKYADRVKGPDGNDLVMRIECPVNEYGRAQYIYVKVWHLTAGTADLYLLDTDIPENNNELNETKDAIPYAEALTRNLYAEDGTLSREWRFRQEYLLGVAGARLLTELGVRPAAVHLNEGHAAFAAIELVRQEMRQREAVWGLSFSEACRIRREEPFRAYEMGIMFEDAVFSVAARLAYTSHTPVPAGNEEFFVDVFRGWFGPYCEAHGIDFGRLKQMAVYPSQIPGRGEMANLSKLALAMSSYANGVSQLHGRVSRVLYGDESIEAITNGVHRRKWQSPIIQELLERRLQELRQEGTLPAGVEDLDLLSPEELRTILEHVTDEEMIRARDEVKATAVARLQELRGIELDKDAFTIVLARRFASYKRLGHFLLGIEDWRTVEAETYEEGLITELLAEAQARGVRLQIVFAGKAHPRDQWGRETIAKIVGASRKFPGTVFFVPNYDMAVAQCLTQLANVWQNNPIPPQEASGTSGMKAAANGVHNASTFDGWIPEADQATVSVFETKEELRSIYLGDYRQGERTYRTLTDEERTTPTDLGLLDMYAHHPDRCAALMRQTLYDYMVNFNMTRFIRQYEGVYLALVARGRQLDGEFTEAAREKGAPELTGESGETAAVPSVDIDAYRARLTDDNSAECGELKLLYPQNWQTRRRRIVSALERFAELYPHVHRVVIARAPGRVTANEHTDYNDAWSLGIPTSQDTIVIAGIDPTTDQVSLRNMEPDVFPASPIDFSLTEPVIPRMNKATLPWTEYARAVYQAMIPRLASYGVDFPRGLCLLVDGRAAYGGVPVESNISSSASFEEAQIYAIEALAGIAGKMTGAEVTEIGRAAEAAIGFPCGKLDQTSSTGGRAAVRLGELIGVAIDCVPRLDQAGRDKTNVEPFPLPKLLQAVLLDTGPKSRAQEEYHIRVIEGELGSWVLARALARLPAADGIDQEKVRELYGDVNTDHDGKPYLYDTGRPYPVFLKPAFFAPARLAAVGAVMSDEEVLDWISQQLGTVVKKDELVKRFGQEFLDFYRKAALPFHYILARDMLMQKGISDGDVDRATLERWVDAWLGGDLAQVRRELQRWGLSPEDLTELEVTTFNLQGTVLHAVGEEMRQLLIRQALQDAVDAEEAGDPVKIHAALARFGELQREGYLSLRDHYRNTSPNIEAVAEWLWNDGKGHPWLLVPMSCRHFGAGWGGWMEIWIRPFMYATAAQEIEQFLRTQSWYEAYARDTVPDQADPVDERLARGIMPFSPGAPAGLLGVYLPEAAEPFEVVSADAGESAEGIAAERTDMETLKRQLRETYRMDELPAEWEAILAEGVGPDRPIAYDPFLVESRLVGSYRVRYDPMMVPVMKDPDKTDLLRGIDEEKEFNFNKIRHILRILRSLTADGQTYTVFPDKNPLYPGHLVCFADELRTNVFTLTDMRLAVAIANATLFCVRQNTSPYTVNHFHMHLGMNRLPAEDMPLNVIQSVGPVSVGALDRYPMQNLVFASADNEALAAASYAFIRQLQIDKIPHFVDVIPGRVIVYIETPDPAQSPAAILGRGVLGVIDYAGEITIAGAGEPQGARERYDRLTADEIVQALLGERIDLDDFAGAITSFFDRYHPAVARALAADGESAETTTGSDGTGASIPERRGEDVFPADNDVGVKGVILDRYLRHLSDERSDACEELKLLYQDEWRLRRDRLITLLERYRQVYPNVKEVFIGRAPGRITLNEYVDFQDSVTLALPVRQDVYAVIGINPDNDQLILHNMEERMFPPGAYAAGQIDQIPVQVYARKEDLPWTEFALSVYKSFLTYFRDHRGAAATLPGLCVMVDGRSDFGGVPLASNISSSAAFEVAQIYALEAALGMRDELSAGEVIEMGRQAELAIGFPCGKLDQGTSTVGREKVPPGTFVGAFIDGIPYLDEKGRDKTVIRPVPIPEGLEAVLVDTGPKTEAYQGLNVRVIEGELGAWVLAQHMAELSPHLQGLSADEVAQRFPSLDPDHGGSPYLQNSERAYPPFFKPGYFTALNLGLFHLALSSADIEEWVSSVLPEAVTYAELTDPRGSYRMPPAFFEHVVANARKIGIDVENLSFNLRGTVMHVITETRRAQELPDALALASADDPVKREEGFARIGQIEIASYRSLRDNNRNTTPEIEEIAEWAMTQDWCLAPRHFGAGWGGWMEFWVKPGRAEEARNALEAYLARASWYQRYAREQAITVTEQLQRGIIPFNPGAPASLLGLYHRPLPVQTVVAQEGGTAARGTEAVRVSRGEELSQTTADAAVFKEHTARNPLLVGYYGEMMESALEQMGQMMDPEGQRSLLDVVVLRVPVENADLKSPIRQAFLRSLQESGRVIVQFYSLTGQNVAPFYERSGIEQVSLEERGIVPSRVNTISLIPYGARQKITAEALISLGLADSIVVPVGAAQDDPAGILRGVMNGIELLELARLDQSLRATPREVSYQALETRAKILAGEFNIFAAIGGLKGFSWTANDILSLISGDMTRAAGVVNRILAEKPAQSMHDTDVLDIYQQAIEAIRQSA